MAVALDGHIFLHDDGVRARGKRRAGQDSHSFAGPDDQVAIHARRLLAHNPQPRALSAGSSDDGIAVHRGVIERWQRKRGDEIPRRKTSNAAGERKHSRRQRADGFQNSTERFFLANHCATVSQSGQFVAGRTAFVRRERLSKRRLVDDPVPAPILQPDW